MLVIVLVTVMASFVVATVVARRTSAAVEGHADTIVVASAPSIERLSDLRSRVFEVELMLSERLQAASSGHRRLSDEVDVTLSALDEGVQRYLELPVLYGERPFWRDLERALVRFQDSVRRTATFVEAGNVADARTEFDRIVEPAGQALVNVSIKTIEFHARRSRELAARIKDARRRAIFVSNALTLVCLAVGGAGVGLLLRQARRHRAVVEGYTRFHETRANELEVFAGRVAHDIRNPLATATMAAQLVDPRSGDDETRDLLERLQRGLSRADAIVTALLDFARSGGRPDPGARTDPRETLHDFSSGVRPEAEKLGIELRVEPVPAVLVACSQGVYLSLVGNLVRNAMKYMGDAVTRHIVVRVRVMDEGRAVRTEVADTGSGIAAASLPSIFEPYFRAGQGSGKEGLGLGLATVKRLAEGHRGSVGVTSERGKGSTFWFVLPRAGSP
jgi:signal transduction histidine kinase